MFVKMNAEGSSTALYKSYKKRRYVPRLLAITIIWWVVLTPPALAEQTEGPATSQVTASSQKASSGTTSAGKTSQEKENQEKRKDTASEDIGINTPADWPGDSDFAKVIATQFRETLALNAYNESVGAAAYIKPQVGAVYVEWLRTRKPIDDPPALIRATLDKLRHEATGASEDINELEYRELKEGEVVEARAGWRHQANETLTVSRTLIWLTKAKHLRVVRASCLFAEVDRKKVQKVCQGVLVSLTSNDIDNGNIAQLGEIPGAAANAATSTTMPPATSTNTNDGNAPSLQANPNASRVLYKNNPATGTKSKTSRWIFVVGALLIAFALFNLTQSRKSGRQENRDDDDDDDDARNQGKQEEEEE